MVANLDHRGPDDHGVAVFADAVIGNARLSIIDPEGGRQPLFGPDERTALVCNGEIYGHRRIRAALSDYPFRTGSDCEAALALYQRHGTALLDHLPGTFALAIWDDDRRQLLLARDRFGERPLYWTMTADGLLAFASETRALRAGGFLDSSPDPSMVAEMLRQGYVPADRSIWSGVRQVPHAGRILWDLRSEPRTERWWRTPEVDHGRSIDDAVDWFRAELERAVVDQMEADVPLGTFLSGGIDSTTIAALAARHHPDLHAFTFDMPNDSELAYAQATADRHSMQLHVCRPDSGQIAQELLALPDAYDEPFGDSSALPTRLLCRFARERVTVTLTGDGADELLGGYLVWTRSLLEPGTPGSTESAPPAAAAPSPNGLLGRLRRGRTNPANGAEPRVARRYASFRQYFDAAQLERLGLPCRDAEHVDVSAYRYGTADDISRFDLDHYLPGDILVKTDRASMSHGLEVRSPFLDVAVAEGCLALSAEHKVDATHEKLLLRRAFSHLWPDSVANRTKQGFGSPMGDWLALPEVEQIKQDLLVDPVSPVFELIDHSAAQAYVSANDQRTWNLLVLAIWWARCRSQVSAA
jgi:asparagine synthase (glutamine-hydrolysing)